MKVFITGGDGYIGSNLTARLRKSYNLVLYGYHRVWRAVFPYQHNTPGRLAPWRLPTESNNDYKSVSGDTTDIRTMAKAMKSSDLVIHLTIPGTNQIIECMNRVKAKRIIFPSTYTILSDVLTPYARYKLNDENTISSSGLEYVIFRISHIYGYGVGTGDMGGVLVDFIQQALTKNKIVVSKDGYRDYIHIADVIECICSVLTNQVKGIFNLGSGQSITLCELAELIADRVKFYTDRIVEVIPPTDRCYIKPILSIEKIREETGFEPKITLTEGIDELINKLR